MLNLVNDFGADPTGVANCDAAVNAWMTTGKDCEVPAGSYRVLGSGSQIFLQTKPGILWAEPQKAKFILDNAVPTNRSFIRVKPDPTYKGRGYGFFGFDIEPETLTLSGPGIIGNHGIIFDTTDSGVYLRQPIVERVGIHNLAGNSILSVNSNTNGFIMGVIRNCPFLNGGINLNSSGDSVQIYENIISGNGIGIFVSPVPGATRLSIRGNNVSSLGGCVYLQNPNGYLIQDNNLEQNAGYNGGVDAMVFVSGAFGGIIRGNAMNSLGNAGCVRLVNCAHNITDGNTMFTQLPHKHIWDVGGISNIQAPNRYVDSISNAVVTGYF